MLLQNNLPSTVRCTFNKMVLDWSGLVWTAPELYPHRHTTNSSLVLHHNNSTFLAFFPLLRWESWSAYQHPAAKYDDDGDLFLGYEMFVGVGRLVHSQVGRVPLHVTLSSIRKWVPCINDTHSSSAWAVPGSSRKRSTRTAGWWRFGTLSFVSRAADNGVASNSARFSDI